MKAAHWESELRCFRRISSITIGRFSGSERSVPACNVFFDLLFRQSFNASVTQQSSRVRLENLTVFTSHWWKDASERIVSAVPRCLLRCSPLRSIRLFVDGDSTISIAALRHVAGSGRLLHMELRPAELLAMVYADSLEAKRSWRGARLLQSLVLQPMASFKVDLSIMALCRALPSLTHLYSSAYLHDDVL